MTEDWPLHAREIGLFTGHNGTVIKGMCQPERSKPHAETAPAHTYRFTSQQSASGMRSGADAVNEVIKTLIITYIYDRQEKNNYHS